MDLRRFFIPEARSPWFWVLNLLHAGGFFLAVGPYPRAFTLGLFAFGLSLVGQFLLWRKLWESWTGQLAGFALAMWVVRVTGHDEGPVRPNIALAIVLVAGESILALLLDAWKTRRQEAPLTPRSGDT